VLNNRIFLTLGVVLEGQSKENGQNRDFAPSFDLHPKSWTQIEGK
jgi:hypothetical protein